MSRRSPSARASVVAVDTGGTFTDFFVLGPAGVRTHKVLSTPRDPSLAVARGLKALGLADKARLIHGSTVATNALLEGKGARVVLVTTAGFEDLLEIGRQNRPRLYALEPRKTPPLVQRSRRLGVAERIGAGGVVLQKLSAASLQDLERRLRRVSCDAIAVCCLHAYANPAHEEKIARRLRGLRKPLSLSSAICPEFREYERCSTTCVNAYVAPIMARYLRRLQARLRQPIRVLQSNGGSLSVAEASRESVRTLLSGPAGGALGALQVARRAGFARILSFDMGGTSSDLSLIDGDLEFTTEAQLGDHPVKTPMIRIDTLGAGGGSLAWIDPGGALRVGPESAGAEPGPVCYGRGGRKMTLTDAHVALGRIPPAHFLGGAMRILPERIRGPLQALAKELRLPVSAAAEGIVRVANANLARSLRVLSLERGHDPRRFVLLAFGGAGPLHAAELAEALEIPQVLVPRFPGLLSAYGMAFAAWRRDYVRTLLTPAEKISWHELKRRAEEIRRHALRDARREGLARAELRFEFGLDLRYAGQSFELTVPLSRDYADAFRRAHRRRYGYSHRGRPLELVNLRLQARSTGTARTADLGFARQASPPVREPHRVFWNHRWHEAPVILREALPADFSLSGPAVVAEFSATTFLPPDWRLRVLPGGELLLATKQGGRRG